MAPVYFPFTHVSPSAATLLNVCFARTAVYQPLSAAVSPELRTLADAGRIDIRVPVDTDGDKLMLLLAEYQNWARLHAGKNLRYFKTQDGQVPFFDDISAHRLSTDIRQRAAGTAAPPPEDPVFDARVFLAVAQEFDSHQGELQDDLAAYREMEQQFLKELKGDDALSSAGLGGGPGIHLPDPGNHMTEKRLEAFARLAITDTTDDRLFITTSPAVFDAALEIIDPSEAVLRIEGMPFPDAAATAALQSELAARIDHLLKNTAEPPETVAFPAPDGAQDRRLSLRLHRTPMDRGSFLSACVSRGEAPAPAAEASGGILVGLLEAAL